MPTFFASHSSRRRPKNQVKLQYLMRIAHENCFYFRNVGPINAKAVFKLLKNHHSSSKMA